MVKGKIKRALQRFITMTGWHPLSKGHANLIAGKLSPLVPMQSLLRYQ